MRRAEAIEILRRPPSSGLLRMTPAQCHSERSAVRGAKNLHVCPDLCGAVLSLGAERAMGTVFS